MIFADFDGIIIFYGSALAALVAIPMWTVGIINLSKVTDATRRKPRDLLVAMLILLVSAGIGWQYARLHFVLWFFIFGIPGLFAAISVLQWCLLRNKSPNK